MCGGVGGSALAGGFKEHDGTGSGNVQGGDLARHGNAEEVVAGAADEVVEALAFASEDDDGVSREVKSVVGLGAVFIEADDPEVVFLELLEGPDEIDDAGEAEVLGGSGGGFEGDGAEGGGAAFGEEDAIDTGSFGRTEERAEVLGVFDAVEREEEMRGGAGGGRDKIFEVEEITLANDGDHALMGGGSGEAGEGIAGLGADWDGRLAAEVEDGSDAGGGSGALAGDADVVKVAGPGAEGFLDRVEAVEDFHFFPVYPCRGAEIRLIMRGLQPRQGTRGDVRGWI